MTALKERFAALDDEKVRAVLVGAGFLVFALLAALTFGGPAVDVVLFVWLVMQAWERANIFERAEQAADDADRADRRVADLVGRITGDDEPTGRHAHRKPTPYKREAA